MGETQALNEIVRRVYIRYGSSPIVEFVDAISIYLNTDDTHLIETHPKGRWQCDYRPLYLIMSRLVQIFCMSFSKFKINENGG